ncbi:hypothetical protein BSNK01_16800 [Bacillaceae bacterium]
MNRSRFPLRGKRLTWQPSMDWEEAFRHFYRAFDEQVEKSFDRSVRVEETNGEYRIYVYGDDLAHPKDIVAGYENGCLHLRRTVEGEEKAERKHGFIRRSFYEHFAQTIPLPRAVRWRDRVITARKGCWSIRLPKK